MAGMQTFSTPARGLKTDGLVAGLLIALILVPVAEGALRVVRLASGAETSTRFLAMPAPAVLHILSASLFCILGAFQFGEGFRRRRPDWHRAMGRVLVPAGLLAAVTGLWMTQVFGPAPRDRDLVYLARLVFGSAMAVCILLGLGAILRREIASHRAWMTRGYALGMAAGTQSLLLVPLILITKTDEPRAAVMIGGWLVNLAAAEVFIRRGGLIRRA